DDARDDRGIKKTGFAPSLDLVVSDQQPADVARDGGQDRLSPTLVITVSADNEPGPLFGAFLIRKDELDQDDVASVKACHTRRPSDCSKGPPTPDQRAR